MAANRKHRDPPRPLALANTPAAWWDGEFWRDGPDGEYWYDEATAAKAARFFPQHLKFTEGEWAGRPFVLEAWQEHDIVRPTFGWKRADGTRRRLRAGRAPGKAAGEHGRESPQANDGGGEMLVDPALHHSLH